METTQTEAGNTAQTVNTTSSFWTSPFASFLSFIGLGPKNPHTSAPLDYVRIRTADLLHSVETDAEEARLQGAAYVEHIRKVVDTRNRLKTNAIADARHVINRWEALADQSAARIAALPADQQAEAARREMQALVAAVEVDFRTLVPEDITLMANQLSSAILAGEGDSAIAAMVNNLSRAKTKKTTTAYKMTGADPLLETAIQSQVA